MTCDRRGKTVNGIQTSIRHRQYQSKSVTKFTNDVTYQQYVIKAHRRKIKSYP